MDLTIERLEDDDDETYLSYLNTCFPGWGNRETHDWVFARDSGAGRADRLYARSGDEIIGGTAVTYRRARNSDDVEAVVGIMTASWTLRAARGKGCFPALLDAMLERATERGCALLTAYARKNNPSYKGLLRKGCVAIPSAYLRDPQASDDASAAQESASQLPLHHTEEELREVYLAARQHATGKARFAYDFEAWKGQFLSWGGGSHIDIMTFGSTGRVLYEIDGEFFRVLSLSVSDGNEAEKIVQELFDHARSINRRLFLFSVVQDEIERAIAAGCERINGGFFFQLADGKAFRKWMGIDPEQPLVEANLLDREHPAYIGDWLIHNQDRM